jgi:fimbrial isopeptide formation D2 family protein
MFRKIVSNLPFSPALVGQLGFYAKRLRKEESTRRIGLIFTALALVVQGFAVFSPPESANAANGNNVIYGGFSSKDQFLSMYDQNKDSAGHTDLQQIYTHFGISRQDIANSTQTNFNSRDFNLSIKSVGRSTYEWQRTPISISGTSTTVYESLLYKFDSTSWTTVHGSSYPALIGKRAVDGQWFAIMMGCGNPAYISLPPPPPQPAAACSKLTITPVTRTRFTFNGTAAPQNGATISSYTYVVKDNTGKVIDTRSVASGQTINSINYDFTKDGSYTVTLTVNTSVGPKTAPDCAKPVTISPEPRCPLNPDLVASNPDCKPCEDDKTIWYKDKNCTSTFELGKVVKNITQLKDNANNTTAKPGDRLEYRLSVKNTGKTSGSYTLQDNMSDVLEYADVVDTGGGTLSKKDAFTPVEKVGIISWPTVTLKPGESVQKIVSVQVKATIPATPQSVGNPESYNCRLVNNFSGHQTTIMVDCPTPKVVEQVVTELPKTGATENMIAAGAVLALVVYFYARARQMKKEVRLIRKDLNAGTI